MTSQLNLLNPEEIAARRVPMEVAELSLGRIGNWYCHYCKHRFTNETVFMKHHCEPKRRAFELLGPVGQSAYALYREWMKQRRYSIPTSTAFLESKYYRAFINFAELVAKANIGKPDKYIELMIAGQIQPVLWCRDAAYSLYLDWADKRSDPLEQVQDSINYIIDVCEHQKIPREEFFQTLGAQEILSLVRQRRLSPWLLFCSKSFGAFIKTLDTSQLKAFNSIVNAVYWADRFSTEKDTIETIKHIATEMGL